MRPEFIWRHSPDTEEIRLHLLELLDGLLEHTARDRYPIGHSLAQAIIWQLGQFKEQRTARRLEWIRNNLDGGLSDYARATLEKIRGRRLTMAGGPTSTLAQFPTGG